MSNIAVKGSGIGGLDSAIGLQRQGLDVNVFSNLTAEDRLRAAAQWNCLLLCEVDRP